AALGRRERRGEPRADRRRARRQRRVRRRGTDAEAVARARAGARGADPQAHLPHHRPARAGARGGEGDAGAPAAPSRERSGCTRAVHRAEDAAQGAAPPEGAAGAEGREQAAGAGRRGVRGGEAEAPRCGAEANERAEGERVVGQKVHPGGLRVGVIHDWKSNWYVANKDFAGALLEDVRIRDHIYGKLAHAGLSDILIRKDKQRITIDIYTARPGIVIGKSGVEVDALRREIHAMTHKNVQININEIKRPELDAKLVAQSIAEQLQNRVSFRRAMKRSLASAMRSGAHGVKVMCAGRLGGAEMSRSESYSEGRVPLHTIRADIDYGFAEAKTTFGRIGVKVWINKGEIMPEGFEGMTGGRELRLGDQDQARRRRGSKAAAVPTGRVLARCAAAGRAAEAVAVARAGARLGPSSRRRLRPRRCPG